MCPRQAYCPALRGAGRSLELATKQAKNIIPQLRKVLLIHTVRVCGLSLRALAVCITALHTAAPPSCPADRFLPALSKQHSG